MATYTERLASCEAAIARIEIGLQEGQDGDSGRVRYADLDVLYAERRRLEPLAAREASGQSSGISIGRGAGA